MTYNSLVILLYIYIKKFLWFGVSFLFIISSIYFCFKLKFKHLDVKKIRKSIIRKEDMNTLFLSLGGRIGVGTLAGTAVAIKVGGDGCIFWLFITVLLSSVLAFLETILGNKYKVKSFDNTYHGGPSYYLKYGLSKNKLSIIYACLLIVSYIFGFSGVQSNTITVTISNYINISNYELGLIISIVTLIIIFGGIKKIIKVSERIVPFMALLYILIAFLGIIINLDKLPRVLNSIIVKAFDIRPFFSSFIPMLIIGLQRGVFSSEAGLGTGAVSSSVNGDKDYIKQGYIQVFGVFVSGFICLITAIFILVSEVDGLNLSGIGITNFVFHKCFGLFGDIVMVVCIVLFSFSTILTGYYYGESALYFLLKNISKSKIFIFKIITVLFVFISSIMPVNKLWDYVDILIGVLALINIYGIFCLRKEIFRMLKC